MNTGPSRGPAQRTSPAGGGTRVRGTRQGVIIGQVLAELPEFRSAQDIHGELRRRGERTGLATVYRHLQALRQDGTVDAIQDQNGETLYRRCESSGHHHHVTCRSCGSSIEVEGGVVERWAERVAEEAGFTDIDHTVEIFGTCPACARGRG
ncbi:Fur family transcriptional regulator [Actinomadura sp. 7K507]|uniref:Fur family transcriptional regulator n=1 Tax=Actinomadura sp. 7K507 TaxID=2530365 RepID=UPI0010477D34|nr:Fur family transcriptional regulator [Actinomadura sp. 7K507]TDC76044.1 transcriptional repressor [Actinomadura sp. 7K507]